MAGAWASGGEENAHRLHQNKVMTVCGLLGTLIIVRSSSEAGRDHFLLGQLGHCRERLGRGQMGHLGLGSHLGSGHYPHCVDPEAGLFLIS